MVTDVGDPRPSLCFVSPPSRTVLFGEPRRLILAGERSVGLAPVFLRVGLPCFAVLVGDESPYASYYIVPSRRAGLPSMKSGISSP